MVSFIHPSFEICSTCTIFPMPLITILQWCLFGKLFIYTAFLCLFSLGTSRQPDRWEKVVWYADMPKLGNKEKSLVNKDEMCSSTLYLPHFNYTKCVMSTKPNAVLCLFFLVNCTINTVDKHKVLHDLLCFFSFLKFAFGGQLNIYKICPYEECSAPSKALLVTVQPRMVFLISSL